MVRSATSQHSASGRSPRSAGASSTVARAGGAGPGPAAACRRSRRRGRARADRPAWAAAATAAAAPRAPPGAALLALLTLILLRPGAPPRRRVGVARGAARGIARLTPLSLPLAPSASRRARASQLILGRKVTAPCACGLGSACVALAWGILLIITAAAGPHRAPPPGPGEHPHRRQYQQHHHQTHEHHEQATLTSSVTSILSSASAGRPGSGRGGRDRAPPSRDRERGQARAPGRAPTAYVVQPGDTLSGIAAALGIPGGWFALYAANRRAVGPRPGPHPPRDRPGPAGPAVPARYTVAAGDTLSGIAAALATPGGWPALYAANRAGDRRRPRRDPRRDRARDPARGIVGASPAPASRPPPGDRGRRRLRRRHAGQAPASAQPPAPATAAGTPHRPGAGVGDAGPRTGRVPGRVAALPTGGLPRWLEIVLVAAGLLIATAFLTEPALAHRPTPPRGPPGPAADEPRIVLADYERLVVTHSRHDGTVYVLRPPGADPHAILLAARLVLAQDRYEELAGHLGVPAHWSSRMTGGRRPSAPSPGAGVGRQTGRQLEETAGSAALPGRPAGWTGSGGTPPAPPRAAGLRRESSSMLAISSSRS